MPLTDRELWILNFFRNSELHGALLMGRLARTSQPPELLKNITRHCATEAHHAALLTELIAELGGTVDPKVDTVQEHYSRDGGVPTELVDLLVLSQTLEQRVLITYRHQADTPSLDERIRHVLEEILREEEEHGDGEECWLEQALRRLPAEQVRASRTKWQAIDRKVAAHLQTYVDGKFPVEALA
jgi:bacterioferritin (cytochrome b1)